MTIKDRLEEKLRTAPRNSIIIIDVDVYDWYDILAYHIYNNRTILLRRWHSEFTIVSEKEMNDMGWYKRED